MKKLLGSFVVACALVAAPMGAFAAHAQASTTAAMFINSDGLVHVMNAEVTSISGTIVNAVTRFKNSVVTWAFNTNASTTILANNSSSGTLADIHVGDKLKVVGSLNAIGSSTISVDATKIKDKTSMAAWRTKSGTIESINLTNGTFVVKSKDGKSITVQTNAATLFTIGSEFPTANILGKITINSKVHVSGTADSTGNLMTASKVVVKTDGEKHSDKHKGGDKKRHGFLGAKIGLGFGNR